MTLQLLLLLLERLEGHVPRVDVHVGVGRQHGGQGRGHQGAWLPPINSRLLRRLQHTASIELLSSPPQSARALVTFPAGEPMPTTECHSRSLWVTAGCSTPRGRHVEQRLDCRSSHGGLPEPTCRCRPCQAWSPGGLLPPAGVAVAADGPPEEAVTSPCAARLEPPSPAVFCCVGICWSCRRQGGHLGRARLCRMQGCRLGPAASRPLRQVVTCFPVPVERHAALEVTHAAT